MKTTIQVLVLPFPDLTLFPHVTIPLYVFDKELVQLLKDCENEQMPVAIGLGDTVIGKNGHPIPHVLKPKDIMGFGHPVVTEEFSDGSINVLIKGAGKVYLKTVLQGRPFMICEAEIIEEVHQQVQFQTLPAHGLKEILFQWIEASVLDPSHKEALYSEIRSVPEVVTHMAAFMVKDKEVRQLLLECDGLAEKIQILELLFRHNSVTNIGHENEFYGNIVKSFQSIEKTFMMAQ